MANTTHSQLSKNKNHINHTIIDYRNGKYQGTIQAHTRLPHGNGMFLTQDYQIALGYWKQGRIQGECFFVHPNGNICFGIFSRGQPQEMCCFQFSNGKILYSFTSSSQDCVCLVDNQNKLITVVHMHRDSRKQFFGNLCEKKMNQNRDEIKQGKGVFFRKKIEIVQEVKFANQLQKWMKIEEYSKQVIKSEFKDYKSFIKFYFCNLPETQLELTHTKQEVQLRFKKSSIICHIIQNQQNQNMLRCKLMGYYDESKRKVEILRKIGQGMDNKVQEICEQEVFSYNTKRPIQAKQRLIDYFKKSTHFVNSYINSKQLQIICTYFESLYEMIDSQISSKKAQNLLELGLPSHATSPAKEKYNRQSRYTNYTNNIDPVSLSQVTNQTLEKINRKNGNHYSKPQTIARKGSNSNLRLDYKSPSRYQKSNQYLPNLIHQKYGQAKENYYSPQKRRGGKITESSPMRQKSYLIFAEDSSPFKKNRLLQNKMKEYQSPSKGNKKYTYITNQSNQINAGQHDQRYSKKKLTLDLQHSRSDYLYREEQHYQPADKIYGDSNKKRESIKKLTKDYEIINQKLTAQRQTRKDYQVNRLSQTKHNVEMSRSPKKYSYLQSPMYSPGSQSQKGRRQWR